jgi:DNA (cytosine-5)-methyltransferase 1
MAPKWKLRNFIDTSVPFDAPEVQLSDKEKELFTFADDGTLCVREGTKKGYHEVLPWQIVNVAFPGSKNRRGRVGDNAKTITTGPRQAIFYDGKLRMLTSKEYLRLMGFKDADYNKMVAAGLTNAQMCTLAGNSICVPVLEQIFKELIKIEVLPNPKDTFEKPAKKATKKKTEKASREKVA